MKKLLLGGVIIGAAIYIYNKQKQSLSELSQSLTVNPSNISVDASDLFSPKLVLTLELNNPTPTAFSITKIFATITNNGQQIATINNNVTIDLSAQQISKVPVQINLNTVSILTQVAQGNLSDSVTISGYVQAGLIQVPFTKILTLPKL